MHHQYIVRKILIQRLHGRLSIFLIFKVLLFIGCFFGCAANYPQSQQDFSQSFNDDEISRINEQILASAEMPSDP